MSVLNLIKPYCFGLMSFICLDIFFVGFLAKGFLKNHLGHLMADSPNWAGAILFYAIYFIGLSFFVIHPSLENNKLSTAVLNGAVMGLVAYGTYESVNWALIKNWSPTIVLPDILWGIFATALAGAIGFWSHKYV